MSDLHHAVRAEIDAFQPDHPPPFEDLLARRRTAFRRKRAAVAASGCLTIVAVLAAGAAVLGGGQDRLMPATGTSTVNDPPPEKAAPPYQNRYEIRYGDDDVFRTHADAVSACLVLPGTSGQSALYSLPPIVSVTVTGLPAAETFEACIRRIPGVTLTVAEEPVVGGLVGDPVPNDPASREAFLPEPGAGTTRADAAAEGRLEGDARTGCLWLTVPGGARLRIIVLHDTAVADFSRTPFVIRDGDQVLATEGDIVVLGGGSGPADDPRLGSCPVDYPRFFGAL